MTMPEDQLRVTIDVSSLPYARGVSRYTSNLVAALVHERAIKLNCWGYSSRQRAMLQAWARTLPSSVTARLQAWPPRVLHECWQQLRLPPVMWLAGPTDVFHAWERQLAPGKIAQVVTIHDLAHLLFPETAHPSIVRQYDQLLRRLEKDTYIQVIAVSQATKQDIVNLTNIAPERVHVVYEALPAESKYQPDHATQLRVRQELGLRRPYFLFVGTTEPRKNLNRMIQAWHHRRGECDLVVAGAAGWDSLPQYQGIHYLGYTSPEVLACLYQGAIGLLYASLYEGFGLPILEAYYHRCPVITARVSSLPEVAKDAAILVDPYAVSDLVAAIDTLLQATEAQRVRRRAKMARVWSQFSWERAAQETVQVYQRAWQAQQGEYEFTRV